MKLQVVPLPEHRVGEATETPWLLVLSEVTADWMYTKVDYLQDMKDQIGAQGLLVFEGEVEVVQ